ncbi:unnamed protein product [Cuscuta campestris]|uniref:DUF7787 domain-containing protein n=1 Tax=Cuscuta campestris TaxID=132261 RepID=A0A484MIZ2_9ASTE|nr:unnamed protein product [Cuscuta campestris]
MADSGIVEKVERGGASKAKEKLTVEEYLNFIDSNKQLDLIVAHLRENRHCVIARFTNSLIFFQIVDMHGFKSLQKTSKNIVLEAVDSLELIGLGRSTLEEQGVSSHVDFTVKEVMEDLAALKWQECCVTSLQTFNGGNRVSTQIQFKRYEVQDPDLVISKNGTEKKKQKASPALPAGSDGDAEKSVGSCLSAITGGGGKSGKKPDGKKRKRMLKDILQSSAHTFQEQS